MILNARELCARFSLGAEAQVSKAALILELYGPERGAHARSAVGMAALPFNMPVEIEAEVEIV